MELEDKFIETMKVIKGIAEAIKKNSMDKKNSEVQEQLKELLTQFKNEIERVKGNDNEPSKSNDLKVKQEEKSIFSSLKMRNPEEAFNNALNSGLKNPENYMYMNSGEGKDYFKNRETGESKEFKISKESLSKSPIMNRDEFLEQRKPKENLNEKLDELKEKTVKLAKDNNIQWATIKEYQPKKNRDSITQTLDKLIKDAKVKATEKNKEKALKVDKTKSVDKQKTLSRG